MEAGGIRDLDILAALLLLPVLYSFASFHIPENSSQWFNFVHHAGEYNNVFSQFWAHTGPYYEGLTVC